MFTARRQTYAAGLAVIAAAAWILTGCGASDPLAEPSSDSDSSSAGDTIVVGSQAYYSNEIIAEIYAQALEGAGFEVKRQFTIGQRDAYIPALESGEVDVFPEYTGNLLQYYDPDATATTPDEVYAALQQALPKDLTALEMSPATDQDSYTVTGAFAKEHALTSIADLANVPTEARILGGPPELEERPYGPSGLKDVYGIDVTFSATGDTTVEDLQAGTITIANVYTADPRLQTLDLVSLTDPEGLLQASNVVPIVSAEITDKVATVINPISAALTPEGLVALNVQSSIDQLSTDDIAKAWLTENGLL